MKYLGDEGIFPRKTVAYTTASLAAGATETGTVSIAKGFRILRVQFSAAGRVRLYPNAAARTADASRAVGTDPAVAVTLDYVATTPGTFDLSPLADGANTENSPSAAIPLSITATSAGALTVTFTYVRTE